MRLLVATLALALASSAIAQQIEVSEPRKPHTQDATVGYTSTKIESAFDAKKPDHGGHHGFGSKKPGSLVGYTGKLVSWFGIVRELPTPASPNFLIEHKYYDGLNDAHMQLASIFGAGDFRVVAADPKNQITRHCLVRVIGTVSAENDGAPSMKADYIRVWRMGDYAFMDYGVDTSNQRWKKLRDGVTFYYSPEPDAQYYEKLLGK